MGRRMIGQKSWVGGGGWTEEKTHLRENGLSGGGAVIIHHLPHKKSDKDSWFLVVLTPKSPLFWG